MCTLSWEWDLQAAGLPVQRGGTPILQSQQLQGERGREAEEGSDGEETMS